MLMFKSKSDVVTERAISTSDFTVEYDPITGKKTTIDTVTLH